MRSKLLEQSLIRVIRTHFIFSLVLLSAAFMISCSPIIYQAPKSSCSIRSYTDVGFLGYLSRQKDNGNPIRLAVMPFEVPQNFVLTYKRNRGNIGNSLARDIQMELKRSGVIDVVEYFDNPSWPGKRAEFSKGNFDSLKNARQAGYNLVLVGYLEEITNESDLNLQLKIIDTANFVTIWHVRTTASSKARAERRYLSRFGLAKDKPALFDFSGRLDMLTKCSVSNLLKDHPLGSEPGV